MITTGRTTGPRSRTVRFRGNSNAAASSFTEGENPDWPAAILAADYEYALGHLEFMRSDPRDAAQIARDSKWPPNPCIVKGLTQTTLGAPQTIYNGGMLRATVRYFDRDRSRPGMTREVAVLVERLSGDGVGIHLVNVSRTETRNLIVQADAFNEHTFTDLSVRGVDLGEDRRGTASVRQQADLRVPLAWRRSAGDLTAAASSTAPTSSAANP